MTVKAYFNDSSYFNIELCFDEKDTSNYVLLLAEKILNIIRKKYYNPNYPPNGLDLNKLKKLRIVKQQVPWMICKKKHIELSYEVFSKSELRKFEQLTGLELT